MNQDWVLKYLPRMGSALHKAKALDGQRIHMKTYSLRKLQGCYQNMQLISGTDPPHKLNHSLLENELKPSNKPWPEDR
jgi:hypothetical protein